METTDVQEFSEGKKDEESETLTCKKNKKSKKKERKRKYSSSTDGSEDVSPIKKSKHKKKCKKRHKREKDKKHLRKAFKNKCNIKLQKFEGEDTLIGPEIPNEIIKKAQSMAPMSKEEWEKRQNTIRRVYDEDTGRTRLIRGEGEIIEEIVSRERHQEINRIATQGDGNFFQANVKKWI